MAEHGFNVVRTYTAPPAWLLEEAGRNGLASWPGSLGAARRVPRRAQPRRRDRSRVREQAPRLPNTPALLCFAVGNEIPPRSCAGTAAAAFSV